MARYGIGGQQYLDNNGNPLSGGKLYFYETGTTTDKATYSDAAEVSANTQPAILDAGGRQPDIFFTGLAKVVIQDENGTQIDVADPVGSVVADDAFSLWSASISYDVDDIVRGSDSLFYKSILGSNSGNDPVSTSGAWIEIQFLSVWDAAYTFAIGDVVTYGSALWISLTGGNLNNIPATSPSNWRPLNASSIWWETTPRTGAFNAAAGRGYLIDTNGAGFTAVLPASPVSGDLIAFVDYGEVFATQNFTWDRNTRNIMNLASDLVCDIDNFSGTLQYTAARGWILV